MDKLLFKNVSLFLNKKKPFRTNTNGKNIDINIILERPPDSNENCRDIK